MVCSADGRLLRARRNGSICVSIQDDRRDQFTLDFARAEELAGALEDGRPHTCRDRYGRVLEFTGGELGEPGGQNFDSGIATAPRAVASPWQLGEPERVKLATEIRRAVAG